MRVYLACPYSHPSLRTRKFRFNVANEVAAILINKGYIVYSPISHTHPISECTLYPITYDQWLALDEHFIEWCDELWIIDLVGADTSKGIEFEKAKAESLGKPVKVIGYEDVTQLPRLD